MATLTPTSPTMMIRSLVGRLQLSDCNIKSNTVEGATAVLYLEVGVGVLDNLYMVSSNWENDIYQNYAVNSMSSGGHLYL